MEALGLAFLILWILSLWMLLMEERQRFLAPTYPLVLSLGVVLFILGCLVGIALLVGRL